MSRVSSDQNVMAGVKGVAIATANAPMAASALTVTFTTDAPAEVSTTLTIADGDAATVTGTEVALLAKKAASALTTINGKVNTLLAALATGNPSEWHAIPAMGTLLTVAYTTDAPSITPDASLTIADGDAASVVRAEYNNAAEEMESAFSTVRSKYNAILDALKQASGSLGTVSIADLSALLTVVYTTDDPATTANGAITIADGDAAAGVTAEFVELVDEVEAALATARTKINAIITSAENCDLLA